MNTIKQALVAGFFLISIIVIMYFFLIAIDNDIDKKKDEYKKFVGERVVVDKDTLVITDYSLILGKFYLSNGTEISKEYAEKKIVKPIN